MKMLQFEFTILPSSDRKSDVWSVTSITTRITYQIPTEVQPAALHTELIKQPVFSKV